MNDPRVLVVAEQLRRAVPGGIGRAAVELLDSLSVIGGVDVTLWASRPPTRSPGRDARAGDPLARWGWPVRTSPLPGPLLTRAWDAGLCPAPAGFDVVHSVSLASPPLGAARTGRPRRGREGAAVPASMTVHDLSWRRVPATATARGRRWHEAALQRALRSGARLVVPSQQVACSLGEAGAAPDAVAVVPWGADHLAEPDPQGASTLLSRLGVHGTFLLAVATLEPRKNLARVVDAYGRIRGALPEPWPLLVVGPAGWGGVADSLSSQPREGVVLAGPVADPVLTALYDRARVLAYLPLDEGFGFPALEALSRGLVCVASTAVPSVGVGAGESPVAVLADPWDVEAMGSALLSGATDDALRARLVADGRKLAAVRTWRATAERYLELWRGLA